MSFTEYVIFPIIGYLLGSIPTAVWVGKFFYNLDVRDHGSGNAGATNTFRVLGKKAGIIVLIIDILKGAASVLIPLLFAQAENQDHKIQLGLLCGIMASIGHIYPVFAGFRGGKGVATILGFMLALQPIPSLLCVGVFLIVLLSFNYVSVASMSAAIAYPLFQYLFFPSDLISLKILSIAIPATLIFTHRKNIAKLRKGEENKTYLIKKNNPT
jgi:glycerol-3-phosphate acyltransferase PlsY